MPFSYLLNLLISPSFRKYLHTSPPIRALDDHKLKCCQIFGPFKCPNWRRFVIATEV